MVMEFKLMIGGNRMFRKWKFIFLTMISIILLTACGKSLDERATAGVEAARVAFQQNDKGLTEEVAGIKLYKPAGFTMNDSSDAQNIVFTKNDETFILFINPELKSLFLRGHQPAQVLWLSKSSRPKGLREVPHRV